MKTLLINPGYNHSVWNEMYPSGSLYLLAAMAERHGHTARVIQMVTDKLTETDLLRIIKDERPDIIGMSLNTFQTQPAKAISMAIKKNYGDVPIVAGGPHISSTAETASTQFPHIDGFIKGEGEVLWLKMVEKRIKPNGVHHGELLAELDTLPFYDYSRVNLKRFFGASPPGGFPSMYIMASRGCPFRCNFCSKSVYGSKVRYRSPANVFREIDGLVKAGAREIFFQDDTLNMHRPWLDDILNRLIHAKLPVVFRAPFRADADLVDATLLKRMKRAGFWLIFYGVESGNQQQLERIGKGLTLPEIERAFKLTHEAGLKTEASFIVGLPGDTPETINDTKRYYRRLKPYWAGCSAAIPFPGTRYYKEAEECGYLVEKDFDKYGPNVCVVKNEAMSREQIEKQQSSFNGEMQLHNLFNLATTPREYVWVANRIANLQRGR